jgi:hypothetical protein
MNWRSSLSAIGYLIGAIRRPKYDSGTRFCRPLKTDQRQLTDLVPPPSTSAPAWQRSWGRTPTTRYAEQLGNRNRQRSSESIHHINAGIGLRSFDSADIGAVHIGVDRESLLGNA